ncbi:MFS transporter [Candidatus Pacearchaeota archaeon]|nr:MFS transporter [Candidatus Pacearchaeota archaeon]
MSILIRKHHGEFQLSKIGKLAFIGSIGGLASAFITTIWAVYLNNFLGNSAQVGLVSALLSFIAILSYFVFIPLIEKSSKSKLFVLSLIIFGISYLLFSIIDNFYLFLLVAVVVNIFYAIRITTFGLIIKDKSPRKRLPRNEGLIYTFANFSWVIGPLMAGYIASKFGNKTIFFIASLLIFLCIIIFFISGIKDNKKERYADKNIFKNIKDFLNNKNRVITYIIGSGPSFWWSMIYLFIPLYIINNGLNELLIGYFLFAIPIPLILLEYKFSKLTSKIGFRKLFKLGFLIAAIASIICFFVPNYYIVLIILILASIGLAMLEPTTEAYYFKILDKKEEQRFYGPYNTRIEIGGLLGKFIPSLLILILPFDYIFLIFGIAMLFFFFISFKAKEVY